MFNDKNIPYLLFSPLFWYKFISILFYGIGPLSYYFSSKLTIEIMHLYYFTSHETLSKIALIYVMVIALTDLILLILNHTSSLPPQASSKHVNKKLLFFYTLTTGVFCKYFIMIPATYLGVGYPAFFIMFSRFIYISIFLSYGMGRNNIFYRNVFYILVLTEMGSSFLVLSKEYLYMSVIFSSFVVFFYNKNIKSIFLTGAVAGILYVFVIQNLFLVLRSSSEGNFGITSTTELESAFDTAKTIRGGAVVNGQNVASFEAWWDRLSYVKYQGYAVEAYDMQYAGETFQQFKYIFIPRILYPEKPNLNPGAAYNSLVQNSFSEKASNSTGPGLFVEAYWNGGWLYLILTIIYFSFLLFYFSKIVIKNLQEKNYLILMLAVNAIYIGRSIDDWFVGRYGGFILNMIILYLFSVFIYRGLESILNTTRIELNE